jgi:hypothetical protein
VSTNGGTVSLTGTNLLYQPVAGYVGADLLSYVVGDGRGGLATNTVAVQVYSSNVLTVSVSPASTNAECGSSVSLSALTSGELSSSFQWYDNAGNPIAGATNATLTLTNVHAEQAGSWTVVMVNRLAQATNAASLSVSDTTGPVISLNGADPLVIECHSAFSDPGATALDACAGAVLVSVSGGVDANVLGVYTLTYSADDGNGNRSTTNRTVRVVDTTPPAITCPADISVVTTDPVGASVNFTVSATDACDPNPSVVSTPASGSFFAAGTNTVVSTATDASGNKSSCSFRVMVDRAPVVQANLGVSMMQDQMLVLELTNLLAVVSDPDNDPLSVTAAGPLSTNGGTVILTGTNLLYQPVAGYMGADLFSYVVGDGRGGLATNTVLVEVTLNLPYPQGTAFPLEMYEVQVADVVNLVSNGWNIVQNYNLKTTTDFSNYLQGVSAWQETSVAVIPCYTATNGNDYEWTQSQVQSWVQAVAGAPNLAWWDLPEEMRSWIPSELKLLGDYTAWTRLYDPAQHPTYEYTPNNRNATEISHIAPMVDVIGISCYCEYINMPHAWVRYKVEESGRHGLALAGKTQGSDYLGGQKTLVAVLYCAVSNNGAPTPDQTYHDFWSAIASGAQGISVFAYFHALHDNPPLIDNLQRLNLAASQITGPENIGAVVLYGAAVSNVTFTVTSGPTQTVAFQPPTETTLFQYPSLNVLTKTWAGNVYVIAVNSTSDSVSACISNLPSAAASASLPFESRSVPMSGGSFADTFAPWGVHIYKMPANGSQ